MAMEIPHSTDLWYAIVGEEKAIPRVLQGVGRTDPTCVLNPHRDIRGARIIWHQLSKEDGSDMLKAYKNCPHCAIMREDEFLGDNVQYCELVLRFHKKASVRQAACPYMWHAVHASLQQHLPTFSHFSWHLSPRSVQDCRTLQRPS